MRMTYYFYQHLWHHCRLCLTFVMIMVVSITFCLTPRSRYVFKLAVNGRQLLTVWDWLMKISSGSQVVNTWVSCPLPIWICLVIKLKTLVYVGTILFGKFLVTTNGNLSLSFSTIVMRCLLNIFMIYANETFCIALRMSVSSSSSSTNFITTQVLNKTSGPLQYSFSVYWYAWCYWFA